MSSLVHVAVGVIHGPNDTVLLAKRDPQQHQGGKWEFPGGKIERGEDVVSALKRELFEELGILAKKFRPLVQVPFQYSDKSVLLDVWEVMEFSGEPFGCEGQPLQWVANTQLEDLEFPAANQSIVKCLGLPTCIAISGEFTDESGLQQKIVQASYLGCGALLLRSDKFVGNRLSYKRLTTLARLEKMELIVHCKSLSGLQLNVDSVSCLHFDAKSLLSLNQRPSGLRLMGASCHSVEELVLAQKIGCDYAFLSPVLKTQSHPNASPIGWAAFANLCTEVDIPIFALGGVNRDHLTQARSLGAHGIAALSGFCMSG